MSSTDSLRILMQLSMAEGIGLAMPSQTLAINFRIKFLALSEFTSRD